MSSCTDVKSLLIKKNQYICTTFKDGVWRSLVSVLDWGSRGRRFKSFHSDSKQQKVIILEMVTFFY